MSRFIINNKEDKTEEVEFRRAWNGKLPNIDRYISWLSSKGFLTKSETQRKDVLYRQYYRWYNDGDLPSSLRSKGFSKPDMPSKYRTVDSMHYSGEYQLELLVDEFTRKILNKYLTKYGRKAYRNDMKLGFLQL